MKETRYLISDSGFVCGENCPYATHYYYTTDREKSDSAIGNNVRAKNLAQQIFKGGIAVNRELSLPERAVETKNLIKEGRKWIFNAVIMTKDQLWCEIDVLEVSKNTVNMFVVKLATSIKEKHLKGIAFKISVLEKAGFKVEKASILYINNEYILHGELKPEELFIIEDVTDVVSEFKASIDKEIKEIRNLDIKKRPEIGDKCHLCPFWKTCKPNNVIFDLARMTMKKKVCLYKRELDPEELLQVISDPKHKQQLMFELEKKSGIEINKKEIRKFWEKLKYPLAFLDFETLMNNPIPTLEGQRAYEQTVFQFSLHVLREFGGRLEHYEYLANPNTDWRSDLAHSLARLIPEEGSVLVWHKPMEENRLKEMTCESYNSDIRDKLLSIKRRIVDLEDPFYDRVIYCKEMHGSSSVKHVLPALFPGDKNLSYKSLTINEGTMAAESFAKMREENNLERIEEIRKNLLQYCELDTFSLVCILEKMYQLYHENDTKLFYL